MKLEELIKQTKPFKSEWHKLLINLQVTNSWINGFFLQQLKPFDLTPQQYNVLRILRGKYPQAYQNKEIEERMIDKSSNASRIVDKLKSKQLIQRTEGETDRRQVNIKITKKGLDLLDTINAHMESLLPEVKQISEKKSRAMNLGLDELRQSFSHHYNS